MTDKKKQTGGIVLNRVTLERENRARRKELDFWDPEKVYLARCKEKASAPFFFFRSTISYKSHKIQANKPTISIGIVIFCLGGVKIGS